MAEPGSEADGLDDIELTTREERTRRFGLDCPDGLTWKGGKWMPGGEYNHKLLLRNVTTKDIRVEYELPHSAHFSLDFPEPILLRPGQAHGLDVAFRPIELRPYSTTIHFSSSNGSFSLPLRASLPSFGLDFRPALDFGFAPIAETTEQTFTMHNSGQLPLRFHWEVPVPFRLTPHSGELQPGDELRITVAFSPTSACAFVGSAICVVPDQPRKLLKLSGIGKFPHITTPSQLMEFDASLVRLAGRNEQTTVIRNPSLVPASFSVRALDVATAGSATEEAVFSFSPHTGVIPPRGELPVRLAFTPRTTGTYSRGRFLVSTPGGNSITFVCGGAAVGPRVTLSQKDIARGNSINFGDLPLGRRRSHVLFLHNDADEPTPFHLMTDEGGIFSVDAVQGEIPPRLSSHVTFTFAPEAPINYAQRIYILVRNQAPLLVDLLGSGYDEKTRPAPMRQELLDAARLRAEAGLATLGPTALSRWLAENEEEAAALAEAAPRFPVADYGCGLPLGTATRSGDSSMGEIAIYHEVFTPAGHGVLAIEEEAVHFGAVRPGTLSEKKTVHVTNRTTAKVVCSWAGQGGSSLFSVFPPVADVGVGRTVEFSVVFRPTLPDAYAHERLEAVVYPKSNRNFRLVEEGSFVPPQTLTLSASGHSFPAGVEQFVPQVELVRRSSRVALPACHVGDSVFTTVQLRNNGDTPAAFSIPADASGVFSVTPSCGVIERNAFQLLAVRFTPAEAGSFSRRLAIQLNNSDFNALDVLLSGVGQLPTMELQSPLLAFKPTAVGLHSSRSFSLRNVSRLPVTFEWRVADRFAGLLSVEQSSGVLVGGQSVDTVWRFSPARRVRYNMRVTLLVRSHDEGSGDSAVGAVHQRLTLRVLGEGTEGAVHFDPPRLDMGTVLVGNVSKRELVLVNNSDCDLDFTLSYGLRVADGGSSPIPMPERPAAEGGVVKLQHPTGRLPARCRMKTTVSFQPPARGEYSLSLLCRLRSMDGRLHEMTEVGGDDEADLSCMLVGRAGFPTLTFEDVRIDTPTSRSAPSCLWAQLSLRQLNAALATDLTEAEEEYNATKGRLERDASNLQLVAWNFTPAAEGSDDQRLRVRLTNTGWLQADFRFKYPNEKEVEVEHWADDDEPSSAELLQNSIIERKVFSVTPREGSLAPGESMELTFSYSYARASPDAGWNELPVLLSLQYGKPIRLLLRGRTLEVGAPCLFLPAASHELAAMAIGNPAPPVQTVKLHNLGLVDVAYELDSSALADLCGAHHGFPVLACENPKGLLAPGGTVWLRFVFNPLEPRWYTVDIPIHYGSADSGDMHTVLHLTGRGFHPDRPDEAASGTPPPFAATATRASGLQPPQRQLAAVPRQLARLSLERLQFGDMPFGGRHHRALAVRNLSKRPVLYNWDAEHPLLSAGLLRVYPRRGRLEAGGVAMCKFTFRAMGPPQLFSEELSLRLTQEVELAGTSKRGTTSRRLLHSRSKASSRHSSHRSLRREGSRSLREGSATMTATAVASGSAAGSAAAAAGAATDSGLRSASSASAKEDVLFVSIEACIVPSDRHSDIRVCWTPSTASLPAGVDSRPSKTGRHRRSTRTLPGVAEEASDVEGGEEMKASEASKSSIDDFSAWAELPADGRQLIEDVFASIVADVARDSDIARVFSALKPQRPVPFFEQLSTKSKPGRVRELGDAASAAAAVEEEDKRVLVKRRGGADEQVAALSQLSRNGELQDLMAKVMEGTVFNLMQEAMLGEFDLFRKPRKVVRLK
eukprot:PLAT6585.1.p1 GENE.PLAT6585.1~~PLAT6585.1.p1  ORF type:complete len:1751 (+),score=937.33 PLAT6585.1:33-5285(+)